MATTTEQVRGIIDTDLEDSQIQACVDTANLMVSQYLSGRGLSQDHLDMIASWLGAHFIAVGPDRQIQSSSTLGVSFTHAGKTGFNLDATTYGQQAKMLDTVGGLDEAVKRSLTFKAL